MYEKSIELLNTAIADEIAAIHQYMYFHFRLDDLGYAPLANLLKQTAIEEMLHAERVADDRLEAGEVLGSARGGDDPPDQQRRADHAQEHAGGAVRNRHQGGHLGLVIRPDHER